MAITERYVSTAGGGAHDGTSEANAWTLAEMVAAINALGAGGGAGLRVNIKADATYTRTTTTDTLTVGGTSTSPLILRGYLSSITDGYQGRTNGHCCGGNLITTNMPLLSYTTGRLSSTAAFTVFESLHTTGQNAAGQLSLGADSNAVRCAVDNSGTGSGCVGMGCGARSGALDCDCTLSGGSGGSAAIVLTGAQKYAILCRLKGGTGNGVHIASSSSLLDCCVYGSSIGAYMNTTSGSPNIVGNTIVGNTSDGIHVITGSTALQSLFGNILAANGGYGIDGGSADNAIAAAYNYFRNNTLGTVSLATDWLAGTSYGHVVNGTAADVDFINAAGNDYRLRNGSPAQNAIYGSAMGAYQFRGGLLLPFPVNGGLA